jgi:hypothetical protein
MPEEGALRASRRQVEAQVLAIWEEGIADVAAAVLEQAKRGDVRSQQEILRRVLGKHPDRHRDGDPDSDGLRIIIEEAPEA